MEPDGYVSDILGVVIARKLDAYPSLEPAQRSPWYRMAWDLAFVGGWPWARSEPARAAGRRIARIPPSVRDLSVAALAIAVARTRSTPHNVVVKSVNSMMSLEWVTDRYRPQVVIVRRNPLNVVSSWRALDLDPPPQNPEDNPSVQERFLRPLGIASPSKNASQLARTAWNIGLWTTALKQSSERHPEWIVQSHDEMCLDAQPSFQSLYTRLGLDWTPEGRAYLDQADRAGYNDLRPVRVTRDQPDRWKERLSGSEVAEIRSVMDDFPLGTWGIPD